MTYEKDHNRKVDFKYIKSIAEKMIGMPDGKKVLGRLHVKEWIQHLKSFAENNLLRLQQKREHLENLLKQTKEPQKRLLIEKELQELQ